MRTFLTGNTVAAATARTKRIRQLLWLVAKDRGTGLPVEQGFWNGTGSITTSVIDALTRVATSRTFAGLGSMAGLDEIQITSGLQVRDLSISLSQVDTAVAQAVRGYDLRLAPAQFYFGYQDLETGAFVDPPEPLMVGIISKAPIKTPPAGGAGAISITITSQLAELTIPNPAKRSHASQLLRDPVDDFYLNVAEVSAWRIPWGVSYGAVARESHPPGKPAPKR